MLAQEWHKVPPHDGYDRLGTVYEARGENRQPALLPEGDLADQVRVQLFASCAD